MLEFSGLDNLDNISKEEVKSIANNFANKFEKSGQDVKLHITIKKVHKREESEKYEVHARANAKKPISIVCTEYNVLRCMHDALSKLQYELSA